jgi:hypothetical protein
MPTLLSKRVGLNVMEDEWGEIHYKVIMTDDGHESFILHIRSHISLNGLEWEDIFFSKKGRAAMTVNIDSLR